MKAVRRNIVLFGCPGAGKGAQAALLSSSDGIPHVSTGELLRAEIARGTAIGRRLEDLLAGGGFADDRTIMTLIGRIVDSPSFEAGFIMDGFPRTILQARTFDELLASRHRQVDVAIYIRASEEVVLDRLGGRRVCPRCCATFHLRFRPSEHGERCESCGADLVQRPDDRPNAQAERLRLYRRQTEPLIEYYRGVGVLCEVDGNAPVEVVAQRIRALLKRGLETGLCAT